MAERQTYKSPITIESFEAKTQRKRPFTIKIADSLNTFFGSLWFLFLNVIIFIFWVLTNTGRIPGVPVFDPFPFVLLTTTVSLEAIILTVIVLISQNRQSYISTLRDELQLQIMLINEKETTKTLYLLSQMLKKQGIKVDDENLREMLEETDTAYIERKLEKQLNANQKSPNPLKKIEETIVASKSVKL